MILSTYSGTDLALTDRYILYCTLLCIHPFANTVCSSPSSSQRSQGGGDDAAGAAEAGGGGAGWSSGSGGGGGGGGGSGWGTGAGGGSAGPGAGVGFDASGSDAGSEQEGKGNSARGTDERRKYCEFYPFLNDAPHNEMDGEARFRPVTFPDPAGRAVLARASGRLSFQSGEFTATYGAVGGPFEGVFDAIVTSFFVDTAPNVVEVQRGIFVTYLKKKNM